VATEVGRYSEQLATLPRWLVINKIDLVAPDQRDAEVTEIVRRLDWQGPVFAISAATGEGTDELCREILRFLRSKKSEGSEASVD
jgi:GTP-binding protein